MWAVGLAGWRLGLMCMVLAFVRDKFIRVKYGIFPAVYGIPRIRAGWMLPRFRPAPE
jgi:hypothetical protein